MIIRYIVFIRNHFVLHQIFYLSLPGPSGYFFFGRIICLWERYRWLCTWDCLLSYCALGQYLYIPSHIAPLTLVSSCSAGPLFTKKTPPIGIGIPIINLRRSSDRPRFITGIPIPVRWCLWVNRGPYYRKSVCNILNEKYHAGIIHQATKIACWIMSHPGCLARLFCTSAFYHWK